MESTFIRPLEPSELQDAGELLRQLNPELSPELLHERLATLCRDHAHYHLLGAFSEGELVGVAGAWIATKLWCGRYLEIDNLVVSASERSGGLGTRLIEHLEAMAREHGCNVLVLDSYTTNHPSHRLYHRLGFEIWGFHFIKPIGEWKAV